MTTKNTRLIGGLAAVLMLATAAHADDAQEIERLKAQLAALEQAQAETAPAPAPKKEGFLGRLFREQAEILIEETAQTAAQHVEDARNEHLTPRQRERIMRQRSNRSAQHVQGEDQETGGFLGGLIRGQVEILVEDSTAAASEALAETRQEHLRTSSTRRN